MGARALHGYILGTGVGAEPQPTEAGCLIRKADKTPLSVNHKAQAADIYRLLPEGLLGPCADAA
jgi:hypothetical protein